MVAEIEECRGKNVKVRGQTSAILKQEPARLIARDVVRSGDREWKLYSEALGSEKNLKIYLNSM